MKNQQVYLIIGTIIVVMAIFYVIITSANAPKINAEEAITSTPSSQTRSQTFMVASVTTVAPVTATALCQRLATPELTIRSYSQLGDAYYLQSNYEQVLHSYNCLLEINPNDAIAYARRGYALATMGQYEQAMQDYTRSITLNPAQVEVYNNRGMLHTAYGRIGEAMLDFQLAILFDPTHPLSYYNRGTIYAIQGNYDGALIDFNHALQLDPYFMRAHMAIGTIYMMIALDNYDIYQQQTGTLVNQPGGNAERLFVSLRDNTTSPPVSTWYALQVADR